MKNKYELPKSFPLNMGGVGEELDERMKNIFELLEEAPLASLKTFLDIGIGKGQILKWLSKKEKICTGIGMELESYGANAEELKQKYGIDVIESNAEKMSFKDNFFDGIIMSHILEHCFNIGLILKEARRVLSDHGWLFIFVPPHENIVCAGHLNAGWSVGQLMYVLLVSGYNVKNGKFIQYGYNICAFVQKNNIPLPPLRGDKGDIYILQKNGYFPLPIKNKDKLDDSYFGNIKSINWDTSSKIIKKIYAKDNVISKKIFLFFISQFSKVLPVKIKLMLGISLIKIGNKLKGNFGDDSNNEINPKILKG